MAPCRTLAGAALVLAVLCSGCQGCSRIDPNESEKRARADWNGILRDCPWRTDYDLVNNFDGITRIDGYRVWRGSYRGVPLAIYSCIVQQRYIMKSPAGIKSLGIVLVREPHLRRVPSDANIVRAVITGDLVSFLSEVTFPATQIQFDALIHDRVRVAPESQVVAAGRLRIAVEDMGEGKLGFRLNVLADANTLGVFDLETILRKEELVGEKRILAEVAPAYTREQFVARTLRKLAERAAPEEDWWIPELRHAQIAAIDHPLWRDPNALMMLVRQASGDQLAHVLGFLYLKTTKDPFFLAERPELTNGLLATARDANKSVKWAFARLVFRSRNWPSDIRVLEPLLVAEMDPIVKEAVLECFWQRRRKPSGKILQRLAREEGTGVGALARRLIKR